MIMLWFVSGQITVYTVQSDEYKTASEKAAVSSRLIAAITFLC